MFWAKGGIDLIALSIADTTNFGIMRCIVSDPQAIGLLKNAGFTASTTEVIVAKVTDKPGDLRMSCFLDNAASVLSIFTRLCARNQNVDTLPR